MARLALNSRAALIPWLSLLSCSRPQVRALDRDWDCGIFLGLELERGEFDPLSSWDSAPIVGKATNRSTHTLRTPTTASNSRRNPTTFHLAAQLRPTGAPKPVAF